MYGPRVVNVPKMPSLGLLLEHPIFGSYNDKVTKVNENLQPTDAEYRPPIDFDIHRDAMNNFKQKHIYDNMRAIEDRDGVSVRTHNSLYSLLILYSLRFDAWMHSIDSYSGNDLLYLNPKGIIPVAAVIKVGEKRTKPLKHKKRFDATGFTDTSKVETFEEEEEDTIIDKGRLAETEG
jgi:tRNA pseudouridine38-40 synthase